MRAIKISLITVFLTLALIFPLKASAAELSLNPWVNLNSIPTSIASQSLFVYNSKIYVIGGSNFGIPDINFSSNINSGGSISDWSTVNQFSFPRFWHANAEKLNYMYLLGGTSASIANINNVSLGIIQPETNTIHWQEVTPLPQPLALGASVIIGNKLYFAGGNPTPTYGVSSETNQNIYSADINPDGTIGNWVIAGVLPDRLIGFGMLENNGYLYIVGGSGLAGYTSNVWRSSVGADGAVGNNWEGLNSLPMPIWRFGITKSENVIVVAGGQTNNGSIIDNVYYSTINSNGTITNWQMGPFLPYPNCCSPLVSSGNYIYLIGGHDGNNYTDRVLMSQIYESGTPSPSPSPTMNPTPTPTPSLKPLPTPSNSPIPVTKMFFIPGMGASWNVDALINCKASGYNGSWTLAPFAKNVYKEAMDQLSNHIWTVIPFYYDWRQDVRTNSENLSKLIDENTSSNEKVNIVGHSMGGLVARNYIEVQKGGKASKFLAIGSPFKGSALAYPAFVNEEIWTNDLIEKIATTILFKHCGASPSFQNLIPTYSYIRDNKTKQLKDISTMNIQNNYLPTKFENPFWGVKVGTIAGADQKTLKTIEVKPDPKWPDGKPVDKVETLQGDNTVLIESVKIPGAFSNEVINQSHSGIIESTEGINKMLEFFGSPGIEDPPYNESKSALILIGYPGNFWLKDKSGHVFQSEEGIISLLNPKDGGYKLQITPQSSNTRFIAAHFLPNGKVNYKEYKFTGIGIEPKIVNVDSNSQDIELIKSEYDLTNSLYPGFWKYLTDLLNRHK